ncbi:hypothetical protein [Phenylobacterium sp. VNQ135]|uniref:hypothetical protein n=1 Tax=Phenylobacterium sp. VNQ135 TaxID=3400922 RepID=UPI003C2FB0C4
MIEAWAQPAQGVVMFGLGSPSRLVRAARAVGPRGWLIGHDDDRDRLGEAQAALNAAGCGWAQLVGGPRWAGAPGALVQRLQRLAGISPAMVVFETRPQGRLAAWLADAQPESAPVFVGRLDELGDAGEAPALAAARSLGYQSLDPITAELVALDEPGGRDLTLMAPARMAPRLQAFVAPPDYHARLPRDGFTRDPDGYWRAARGLPLPAGRFILAADIGGLRPAPGWRIEAYVRGQLKAASETSDAAQARLFLELAAPAPLRLRLRCNGTDEAAWRGFDVWRRADTGVETSRREDLG